MTPYKNPTTIQNIFKNFIIEVANELTNEFTNEPYEKVLIRKDSQGGFYANLATIKINTIFIGYTLGHDIDDLFFYDKFVEKYPKGEEIDKYLISILHEIGHYSTFMERMELSMNNGYDRKAEIDKIGELLDRLYDEGYSRKEICEEVNSIYINLPDERLATDWAGEWLSKEEHFALAVKYSKLVREKTGE